MTDVMEDNVMEDSDPYTEERTANREDTHFTLTDSGPVPPDMVLEQVPREDLNPEWSTDLDTYIYYYADNGARALNSTYAGRLTARPTSWGYRSRSRPVVLEAPEGSLTFDQLLSMVQAAVHGDWSANRCLLAALSFARHLLPKIRDFPNAEEAGVAAVSTIFQWWPEWTGGRSQERILALGRQLYGDARPLWWRWPDQATPTLEVLLPTTTGVRRTRLVNALVAWVVSGEAAPETDEERLAELNRRLTEAGTHQVLTPPANLRDLLRVLFPSAGIPEEIASLSEAEVKVRFAAYMRRTERTIEAVHKVADERRMCSEFDSIMKRCGWPPRPKWYSLAWELTFKKPYSAAELTRELLGSSRAGELEYEGTIMRKVKHRGSYRIRLADRPANHEAAHDLIPRSHFRDYIGGDIPADAEWTVTRVDS